MNSENVYIEFGKSYKFARRLTVILLHGNLYWIPLKYNYFGEKKTRSFISITRSDNRTVSVATCITNGATPQHVIGLFSKRTDTLSLFSVSSGQYTFALSFRIRDEY